MRQATLKVLGTAEDLVRDGLIVGGPWLSAKGRAEYEALPIDAVSAENFQAATDALIKAGVISFTPMRFV